MTGFFWVCVAAVLVMVPLVVLWLGTTAAGPLFWAVLLLVAGWAGKRAEGRDMTTEKGIEQ